MQRRRRKSYGRRGLARSGRVVGSREGVSSSTAAGLEAVASANLRAAADVIVVARASPFWGETDRCFRRNRRDPNASPPPIPLKARVPRVKRETACAHYRVRRPVLPVLARSGWAVLRRLVVLLVGASCAAAMIVLSHRRPLGRDSEVSCFERALPHTAALFKPHLLRFADPPAPCARCGSTRPEKLCAAAAVASHLGELQHRPSLSLVVMSRR